MSIEDALQNIAEHYAAGRLAEAEQLCQQILREDPNQPDALNYLAIIARQTGRIEAAVQWASRAVAAHPNVAEFHANLGQFTRLAGDLDRAMAEFLRAVELRPNEATFHNSLGSVYTDIRRHELAAAEYRRAIELNPDYPDALNNLGGAMRELDRLDEAIQWISRALQLQPTLLNAHYNLALVLSDQARFDEAMSVYTRCLAIKNDDPHAHWNLGMLHLVLGEFEPGWREYRWRPSLLQFAQPQWNGKDLAGKTIVLHAEQGLGDAIQFVRYAPMVAARGGRVILLVHPELVRLFANVAGVQQVMGFGQTPTGFDVHCSLLSLPGIFQTTLSNIPAQVPYLNAADDLLESAKRRLGESSGKLRVGLVWAGRPEHRNDSRRSLRLEQLAPLLAVPGVEFFSLQKGAATALPKPSSSPLPWYCRPQVSGGGPGWGSSSGPRDTEPPPSPGIPGEGERIRAVAPRHPTIADLAPELNDFSDTAAFVKNFDLIVTVDTSVAHLAGAMGKPVWVFLPAVPDWRWMLERPDSPWYPTMRLFRQKTRGNWTDPINEAAGELAQLSSQT